jgi:hypothetical protein
MTIGLPPQNTIRPILLSFSAVGGVTNLPSRSTSRNDTLDFTVSLFTFSIAFEPESCFVPVSKMSAILSADDLNDFISPGVACIKPIETLPSKKGDDGSVSNFFYSRTPSQANQPCKESIRSHHRRQNSSTKPCTSTNIPHRLPRLLWLRDLC